MLQRRRIIMLGAAVATSTLSAPIPSYPSPLSSNPSSIVLNLGADWISGDIAVLAYANNVGMSGATLLTHTITDTDVGNKAFTFPLPTFAGLTYLQPWGRVGTADSVNKGHIVTWGDTTAPTITTSASQTAYDTVQIAFALTATDTGGVPNQISALNPDGTFSPGWRISGGADQTEYQIAIVGGVPTLQWINNGSETLATPRDQTLANTYKVNVTAVDYGGNASVLALTTTVNAITVGAFSFTNVSNASHSTLYTSNTVTFSITPPGVQVSAVLSDPGSYGFKYSKNGAGYVSAGVFTVQSGDTLSQQVISAPTDSVTETSNLTVGTQSAGWSVATPGSSAQLTATAGTSCSKLLNVTGTPKLNWNIPSGNGGAIELSRANIPMQNNDGYMEATIGTLASRCYLGMTDTSIDFNGGGSGFFGGGTASPGDPTFNGFTLEVDAGGTQVTYHANGTTNTLNIGATAAAGDILGNEYNQTTHVVSVYYKHGASAMALLGTFTLTSLIPSTPYAFTGGKNDLDAGSWNPGNAAFALGGPGPQGSPSGSNIYG